MREAEFKVVAVGGDPENALNPDNPPQAYVHLFEDGDRRMAMMMRNPDNDDAGQPVHFDKELMKECVKAVKESPKAGWEYGSYTLVDTFDSGQEEVRWMDTRNGEPGFMAANRSMKPDEFQDRVFSFGESMEVPAEVDLSKESITPPKRMEEAAELDLSKETITPPTRPGF
jgi:hypothetical protein